MTIKTLHKQNRGITLVALVITIIVLIILAAVSINAVMNGGLIQNAKDASDKWEGASGKEQIELAKIEGMLAAETLKEVKAGEYTGTENKKYVEGGKTAIIPAGFTVSNIDSEKTIAGGLVIYSGEVTDFTTDTDEDGIVNAQENYSQYVWIPVDNPSDIYGTLESEIEGIEGTKFGKLYFGYYTGSYWNSENKSNSFNPDSHVNWPTEANYEAANSLGAFREPTYLADSSWADGSKYSADAEGNQIITKEGIKQEFSDMISSVEKYKGFYIGRYELTGAVTEPSIVKGAEPLTTDTSYSVNSKLRWYGLYTMCEQLEADNDKVKTSMIWGCQWDQTIKKSLIDKTDFLTNPDEYGAINYGTVTGTATPAYNIYDMAGNLSDLTLEGGGTKGYLGRTARGGTYSGGGALPASDRYVQSPYRNNASFGARAQLYIK